MKLEDQVVSLELSKRLKELNIEQESLFYLLKEIGTDNWNLVYQENIGQDNIIDQLAISAFTVSELLDILPPTIEININYKLTVAKGDNNFCVSYVGNNITLYCFYKKNLSDALSLMLIHLIENSLLKL